MTRELEVFIRLWPLFVSVVLLVAWFIRLETKGLQNEKDIQRIKDDTSLKLDKLDSQSLEVLQKVSHLQGKFEVFHKEET